MNSPSLGSQRTATPTAPMVLRVARNSCGVHPIERNMLVWCTLCEKTTDYQGEKAYVRGGGGIGPRNENPDTIVDLSDNRGNDG